MLRWVVAALLGAALLPAMAVAEPTHDFKVQRLAHSFGQAPAWFGEDHVLSSDNLTGKNQVYMSKLDGSDQHCLTCKFDHGPNQVPDARPQGDWILFHSWHGKSITLGGPGYGGLGSEVYAMHPDGTHITRLSPNKEGEDDYHAYFSPDGTKILYTHLNYDFVDDGGTGNWSIRVADFVVDDKGVPSMRNARIVRPENGHFYETQHWAPDGSGFLYTESVGTALNLETFACKLTAKGCDVTRLTHDPAWDEQAIYTPDMKRVIIMSTRAQPGLFTDWTNIAGALSLSPDADNLLALPIFEVAFLQPVMQQANDLWELDLRTKRIRRITDDGDHGFITPEFAWDPSGKRLLWTELKYVDGLRTGQLKDLVSDLTQLSDFLSGKAATGPGNEDVQPDTGNKNLTRRTMIGHYSNLHVQKSAKKRKAKHAR